MIKTTKNTNMIFPNAQSKPFLLAAMFVGLATVPSMSGAAKSWQDETVLVGKQGDQTVVKGLNGEQVLFKNKDAQLAIEWAMGNARTTVVLAGRYMVDDSIDAPRDGLRMRGCYVWCNSILYAEGKWHAFSSSRPKRENPEACSAVELLQNYWCLSTIIRAEADHPEGPYEFADSQGQLTGDVRHGAHLVSSDEFRFTLYDAEPKAYSHTVQWQDGGETTFDRRERPWLIIQDGLPTHLVTGVLLGHEAWSLVQPLRGASL